MHRYPERPSVAVAALAVAVLSGAVNPEDIILLNITGGGVSRVKEDFCPQRAPAGRSGLPLGGSGGVFGERIMKTLTLTIKGGSDKDGRADAVNEVEIVSGEIIGIVGPTGSGKSTLIADIEQFAQGDTPSGRSILIDGEEPEPTLRTDPRKKLVAQLSQNMHFLADMSVEDFLRMHAKSRGKNGDTAKQGRRACQHPDW